MSLVIELFNHEIFLSLINPELGKTPWNFGDMIFRDSSNSVFWSEIKKLSIDVFGGWILQIWNIGPIFPLNLVKPPETLKISIFRDCCNSIFWSEIKKLSIGVIDYWILQIWNIDCINPLIWVMFNPL